MKALLKEEAKQIGVRSLIQLGFQPFDQLAQVFASADILVTILEPDAGVFCVPSKVLSYLCAARPQLLAVPSDNLAARTIKDCQAGLVVDPNDMGALIEAARCLYQDADLRRTCGAAARAYAETHFDFERIFDRFCDILDVAKKPLHPITETADSPTAEERVVTWGKTSS